MSKKRIKPLRKFDPEFNFLLDYDRSPEMEVWRALAAEYWGPRGVDRDAQSPLSHFFIYYLYGNGLHTISPAEFFAVGRVLPPIDEALSLSQLTEYSASRKHDYVSDFLNWILSTKLAEKDAGARPMIPDHLTNPFPRRLRRQDQVLAKFDREFNFLLDYDRSPEMEVWRALAAEYFLRFDKSIKHIRTPLTHFLVHYLYGNEFHTNSPAEFFAVGRVLPPIDEALRLDGLSSEKQRTAKRDYVSDFLDWILRTKLAEKDEKGYSVIPDLLDNPFPRQQYKVYRVLTDPSFSYLTKEIDQGLEPWRVLAAEYLSTTNDTVRVPLIINSFILDYVVKNGFHRITPSEFFTVGLALPPIDKALGLDNLINDKQRNAKHDVLSDFLSWILRTKLAEKNANGYIVPPDNLDNPFPRRAYKKLDMTSDPTCSYLTNEIDQRLEPWREWAAEYISVTAANKDKIQSDISQFIVSYVHAEGFHKVAPLELFVVGRAIPLIDKALARDDISDVRYQTKHDRVVDFLNWILRTKLAEKDANGYIVPPDNLANPFRRIRVKVFGKKLDDNFHYALDFDTRLEGWRALAAEFLAETKSQRSKAKEALDRFLIDYIYHQNLEFNYGVFLKRETQKPDFAKTIAGAKSDNKVITVNNIKYTNIVANFLDWVLAKFADPETGALDPRFHNPVKRLSTRGKARHTTTPKAALSIRYINQLREILTEGGKSFADWKWAHSAVDAPRGSDWFEVDPSIIDEHDPDCVYRYRVVKRNDKEIQICEMWSPVRAMNIYILLELPLRNVQVRMLDSGEADTWRYIHGPNGGSFAPNPSPMATGTEMRPYQRGVFHKALSDTSTSLYINTNKTADSDKPENQKGYVIPYPFEDALYWLEKLRNWQEKYNPIITPSLWTELTVTHIDTLPSKEVLAERGTVCFLFRDPTKGKGNLPIRDGGIDLMWYRLLEMLEQRLKREKEELSNGVPIRLVVPGKQKTTYFSPHSMRVSLITYFVLDLGMSIAVVSKFIAGHSTILMSLYYTKMGATYIRDVMREAEKNELEAEQANHQRFLQQATFDEVARQFAYNSEDAVHTAVNNQSAIAGFIFPDLGICPTGGSACHVGGELDRDRPSTGVYTPVPGFPQERNCVRCRFFLTSPAYLPALMAHCNSLSEKAHRQSRRYNRVLENKNKLEDDKFICEREDRPFERLRELDKAMDLAQAEGDIASKLMQDWTAADRLVRRVIDIANDGQNDDSVKLVANGRMSDLRAVVTETDSELHLLEVVCENAVVYPSIDADYATIRRAQQHDAMLMYNGYTPVFMHLTPEQQLLAGNELIKLIVATAGKILGREGEIKDSLPYSECRAKLNELGLLPADIEGVIALATTAVPARELINHVKSAKTLGLPAPSYEEENQDAS